MYYLILPNENERNLFISKLKEKGIMAAFHYIPLHSSPVGESLGYKKGDLPVTEEYASRLVRLPLWADMSNEDVNYIIDSVNNILR